MSYEYKKRLTDAEILAELRKIEDETSGEEFEFSDSDQGNEESVVVPVCADEECDSCNKCDDVNTAQDSFPLNLGENEASTSSMPSDVPNSSCLRLTTRTTFASPGSQSKTDTGQPNGEKETAKDGTVWKIVPVGSNAGCLQSHSILREKSGPTSYAKRKIQSGKLLSAWRLIFSASMMRHIKHCTEAEARHRTQDDSWTVDTEELDAFVAIM
ncbi:uncharacterized protein LOC124545599 [Schistocerca americana]|uniref:uncharacterized protein LOC124545599 n=1 Tax=Schistocerca americana TaxID=7009 RepID=UPI001F5021FD|nr:uncharacterized protein LOC124545599 [Schistocerca americana]